MPTKRDPRAPCRPEDPPSLHERLIRDLIASDSRMARNGFWRALQDLETEFEMDLEEFTGRRPLLPDAYLIERDSQTIRIYEVEVSLPLSESKLDDYAWLWFSMEAEGHVDWLPELYVVDRYGHRNQIDLKQLYYSRMLEPHLP